MSVQSNQDEIKAARIKAEEQRRLEDMHNKQVKSLEDARTELEQKMEVMNGERNRLKNGTLSVIIIISIICIRIAESR